MGPPGPGAALFLCPAICTQPPGRGASDGVRGSFETLAALAPQDEVKTSCHTRLFLTLRGCEPFFFRWARSLRRLGSRAAFAVGRRDHRRHCAWVGSWRGSSGGLAAGVRAPHGSGDSAAERPAQSEGAQHVVGKRKPEEHRTGLLLAAHEEAAESHAARPSVDALALGPLLVNL